MAYVYRHIRLDLDEVFYIGIGIDSKYKRAYNKTLRSNFWKNIINKTNYIVEIIIDNISYEEAKLKEIEFIKIYGRKDLGCGTLVNLTNGGDGVEGMKHTSKTKEKLRSQNIGKKSSDETKKKISESNKGHSVTNETKSKISNSEKGKIYSEDTRKKISEGHKGQKPWNKGIKMSNDFKEKVSNSKRGKPNGKKGIPHNEETKSKISKTIRMKNYKANKA